MLPLLAAMTFCAAAEVRPFNRLSRTFSGSVEGDGGSIAGNVQGWSYENKPVPFTLTDKRAMPVTTLTPQTAQLGNRNPITPFRYKRSAEISDSFSGIAVGTGEILCTSTRDTPGYRWSVAYLNDGDRLKDKINTCFSSKLYLNETPEEPPWVQIRFRKPCMISRIVMARRIDGGGGFPLDFSIRISRDGTNWQTILKKHPSGILEGLSQMADTRDLVQELSLGGKTIDGNSQFFYALIAMACLYGCFIGFGAAITLQANLTALAARRCVTPTHKLKLILSEQITSFLLGYTDVIILLIYLRIILKLDFQGQIGKMLIISLFGSLIGVSVGLFVGSLGKLSEGIKVAVILAISMVCSFLAGLMNSNMKDLVEKHVPIINRINPAALSSDAFYCINVYNDTARYYRNLVTLAVMSAAFVMASFLLIRRNRYDSI